MPLPGQTNLLLYPCYVTPGILCQIDDAWVEPQSGCIDEEGRSCRAELHPPTSAAFTLLRATLTKSCKNDTGVSGEF